MTNVSTTAVTISQPSNPLVTVTPTDIVNSKVINLVERYRFFAQASAQNVIQLATTLAEANRELSEAELTAFCKEVGIKQKSSTYRKLTHIGLNAARFETHLDRMPTAWTTVYDLAKLSEQDFEKVATNDDFSPTMTAKSITEIVGPTQKQSTKRTSKVSAASPAEVAKVANSGSPADVPILSPKTIFINLDGLDEDDVVETYNNVQMMHFDKHFTFEISNSLRELLAKEASSPNSQSMFQMEQAA
jgi:hypothetical protein